LERALASDAEAGKALKSHSVADYTIFSSMQSDGFG
jgi:hypothetical protein